MMMMMMMITIIIISTAFAAVVGILTEENFVFVNKEELFRLGYDAMQTGWSVSTFRRNVMPPYSELNTVCLLVICLACSSTLKIEALPFSETSVILYQTSWRNAQEDGARGSVVG
jgi:hypothetical protein